MKLLALKIYSKLKSIFFNMMVLVLVLMVGASVASAASSTDNLGQIATNITQNFSDLTSLMTALSYVAGVAFAIAAVMKFKAHKDNPTQIPIGTPIALTFIAAALLFLPSILNVTSYTIFGSTGGSVAGPSGTVYG